MNEVAESSLPERVDPLALGLRFAWLHAPILLLYSLPCLVIEGIVEYLQFTTPLGPPQLFLLLVVSFGASCWLVSAALLTAGQVGQGRTPQPFGTGLHALRNLPKIYLSSVALVFAIAVGLLILPLLVLVLFFIWAPLFCIAELLVPPEEAPDDEAADELYDESDEDADVPRLFTRKSLFDLGFARSLRLGSRSPGLTLQVFVLIWCVNSVPYALVDLLTSDSLNFMPRLLHAAATLFAQALAAGAISGAFLAMLPRESRRELQLQPLVEAVPHPSARRRRTLLFGLAAAVALACSVYTVQQLQRDFVMPESVVARIESVRSEQRSLVFTLRLEDARHRFRWIEGGTFQLSIAQGEERKKKADPKPEEQEAAADEGTPARHVAFYDESGKELGYTDFPPYDKGALKVILNFGLDDGLPAQGRYTLSFVSFFGDKTHVHEGEYGTKDE